MLFLYLYCKRFQFKGKKRQRKPPYPHIPFVSRPAPRESGIPFPFHADTIENTFDYSDTVSECEKYHDVDEVYDSI